EGERGGGGVCAVFAGRHQLGRSHLAFFEQNGQSHVVVGVHGAAGGVGGIGDVVVSIVVLAGEVGGSDVLARAVQPREPVLVGAAIGVHAQVHVADVHRLLHDVRVLLGDAKDGNQD